MGITPARVCRSGDSLWLHERVCEGEAPDYWRGSWIIATVPVLVVRGALHRSRKAAGLGGRG